MKAQRGYHVLKVTERMNSRVGIPAQLKALTHLLCGPPAGPGTQEDVWAGKS